MKPGYKQTEVGVIPEEWEVKSLEQLCDPQHSICYGIVQVGAHSNKGIAVLAIKNLNGDYATNIHRCSAHIEKPYLRSRVCPGDILISVKGTIGRVGVVPSHFKGNISRDLARIRLTGSDFPDFWYQMLQSQEAQRWLQTTTVGTTRMELSIAPLKKVLMPRPPIDDQRAIADALHDVDALIDSLERLIAKKRDIKQGAMQELLTGKKRLPGFQIKSGSRQTEVGVVPEDWEVEFIDNLADITTGGKNTQDRVDDGQYPFFVRSQDIERINSYSFDGEAVMTAGDGVGTGKIFHYINGKFDAHQRVYRISDFCEKLNGAYFFRYFSRHFYNRIMQMTAKSSVDSVRREMIANMLIPLPPPTEQRAIAEVLSDMDAEIGALEEKLSKARAIKQGMMQELLTGRVRLV